MPPWDRLKPILAVGAVGVVAVVWVLAFETGPEGGDWGSTWTAHEELRGKQVVINAHSVETTAERERREAIKNKELHEDVGDVKRSVLGDQHQMRGNDIVTEGPELPPEVVYNPREACEEMKLEYPERYGKVDCMSEKYDSTEPWWAFQH